MKGQIRPLVRGQLQNHERKSQLEYNLQSYKTVERVVITLLVCAQEAGYEGDADNPGQRLPTPAHHGKSDRSIKASMMPDPGT
jgi:hypothetical protein